MPNKKLTFEQWNVEKENQIVVLQAFHSELKNKEAISRETAQKWVRDYKKQLEDFKKRVDKKQTNHPYGIMEKTSYNLILELEKTNFFD